jgi:hypothetical protein
MRTAWFGVAGEIDTLPGCSQVAVSHSVFASTRGNGWGSKAHAKRLDYLQELGYNYVLCTVDLSNDTQKCIMAKFNWKLLDQFTSSKTGHKVALYGKVL